MKYLLLVIFASFLTFNLFGNEDVVEIKTIGHTKEGNQYLLSIKTAYFPTIDPKILTKESLARLQILKCKSCLYTDHVITCTKNRNPLDGEALYCKDTDVLKTDTRQTFADISCQGNRCRLKIISHEGPTTALGDDIHRNILYEMGDAEFIIDKNPQEDVNIKTNKQNENVVERTITPKENTRNKLDVAKNKCLKLGIEEKTEKFADCVLMFYEDN